MIVIGLLGMPAPLMATQLTTQFEPLPQTVHSDALGTGSLIPVRAQPSDTARVDTPGIVGLAAGGGASAGIAQQLATQFVGDVRVSTVHATSSNDAVDVASEQLLRVLSAFKSRQSMAASARDSGDALDVFAASPFVSLDLHEQAGLQLVSVSPMLMPKGECACARSATALVGAPPNLGFVAPGTCCDGEVDYERLLKFDEGTRLAKIDSFPNPVELISPGSFYPEEKTSKTRRVPGAFFPQGDSSLTAGGPIVATGGVVHSARADVRRDVSKSAKPGDAASQTTVANLRSQWCVSGASPTEAEGPVRAVMRLIKNFASCLIFAE